jgi:GT2 family glycosyltransferase
MKIDVISSVFNCDNFLEGFFIDITRQTFFDNCNLILVAPNPSNKLIKITNLYRSRFSNIQLIELDSDPGISKCLNIALKSGNSPYITIANTDDRKRSDSLERHYLELELNPDIDLVYAPSLLSRRPNETYEFHSCDSIYPCYEFTGIDGLLKHNSPHNNPMWRRSMHDKNGLFDEVLKSCADSDMWMRAVLNGSKFKMIPEILGLYYFNPEGMSTGKKNAKERIEEERQKDLKYIGLKNEQEKIS